MACVVGRTEGACVAGHLEERAHFACRLAYYDDRWEEACADRRVEVECVADHQETVACLVDRRMVANGNLAAEIGFLIRAYCFFVCFQKIQIEVD